MAIISIFLATLLSSFALTNGQIIPQPQQNAAGGASQGLSQQQQAILVQALQQQQAQAAAAQVQQGNPSGGARSGTSPVTGLSQGPQQTQTQTIQAQQTLSVGGGTGSGLNVPISNSVGGGTGSGLSVPISNSNAIRQTPQSSSSNVNSAQAAQNAAVAAAAARLLQQSSSNNQGITPNSGSNPFISQNIDDNNRIGHIPGQSIGHGINIGANGFQLGNNNNINGLFTNPLAEQVQGTYQWIGQDGRVYTLYICSGLRGDRFMYSAVQRSNVNAFGVPDGSVQFAFIVARGYTRVGSDGHITTLRGFRLSDAFGVDTDFQMMLVYSRCDNVFQLETSDEVYTLIKISNQQPQQTQCFRPSYTHNFNNMGGGTGVASFQSLRTLPWNFRQGLGGPGFGHGFRSIYTLRSRQLQGGLFNVFGCGGFQDPITNAFLGGRRQFLGNFGPFGSLQWNNALLINAFDDDLFDDDLGFDCDRGMEFQFFTDDNDLFCSSQCWNQPTVGWSGLLSPITPFANFGANQCPVPNFPLLPQRFPGWSPYNPFYQGFGFGY